MFQASDKKIAIEMHLIGEADIKVDSKEFYDTNEDQSNYFDTRGRLSFVYPQFLCYINFIVAFIICFMTIFLFLRNIVHC